MSTSCFSEENTSSLNTGEETNPSLAEQSRTAGGDGVGWGSGRGGGGRFRGDFTSCTALLLGASAGRAHGKFSSAAQLLQLQHPSDANRPVTLQLLPPDEVCAPPPPPPPLPHSVNQEHPHPSLSLSLLLLSHLLPGTDSL